MSDGHSHGDKLDPPPGPNRPTVKLRMSDGGPWLDLGVTQEELAYESIKLLDAVRKKIKLEHVSPIMAAVFAKLGQTDKEGE